MADWIEHDGNDMPVDENTLVICRFRDGDEERPGMEIAAGYWHSGSRLTSNWVHDCKHPTGAEIVAYQVIEGAVQ